MATLKINKKVKKFDVIFGYKAVVIVSINAKNDEDAKIKAIDYFNSKFRHSGSEDISINDDSFKIAGVIDMDDSWNML